MLAAEDVQGESARRRQPGDAGRLPAFGNESNWAKHGPAERTFRTFEDEMAPADDLQAAIAALWLDARARTIGRIETLEEAIAALGDGALEPDLAEHARHEAHKLTGALGTFGMPEGSEHARTVELSLENGASATDAPALAEHVAALRRIAEAGP